ncbi:uncharacterized protein [Centroberyx affinis]|uniref:uncharacterized protein n=1 Tax=Centroberyx affinis TaxID=166261 RepID=UPI003A5C38C3
MGLRDFWRSYKVLIVMGTSLGLIHWGWYALKANPLLRKDRDEYIPEEESGLSNTENAVELIAHGNMGVQYPEIQPTTADRSYQCQPACQNIN